MNDKIKVSIITVSYNSEKTITRTIESVLEQTYNNIEYILIDGNSSDKTVEIIKKYKNKFLKINKGYKYISEKDSGIYDAMNKGIMMASGDIIGIINSDDWYEKDAVEKIVDKFTIENADIVYANMLIHSPKKKFIKKAKNEKYFTTRGWNHPTMFVKKEVYNKFKYRLQSIYDDLDFILRAKKEKYKIEILDETISNFSFGGISTEKSFSRVIQDISLRNKIYKQNGYSRFHMLDNMLIEMAKYLLN